MFYQQNAGRIADFLKTKLPQFSIEHKWDPKLEVEWYFLQHERQRIRILVPRIFLESIDRDEFELKIEALRLVSYIQSGKCNYIVISDSDLTVDTF